MTESIPDITVAGRRLRPGPVFDTYWRFAAARQEAYFARLRDDGTATSDPILARHRFTNCYRAADRVSQFAIHDVAYGGPQEPRDVVFRMMLFKFFNKIDTWRLLEAELGPVTWASWHPAAARAVLDAAWRSRRTLYSPAYVIPPPRLGGTRKHHDHLLLAETMIHDGLAEKLQDARGLAQVFELLRVYPGLGDFLAFQFSIDLNYTSVLDFSENDFVVAGPGARDGARKCFGPAASGIEDAVIAYLTDTQEAHFARLGLRFASLGGRRLHLVDCQNLFCEVDKYARVAHPAVPGISGRTRIKQQYHRSDEPMPAPWFPPKWGITEAVRAQAAAVVVPR
ncbi:putative DNA base hypermodification protein [Amycolatopsis carbonis]|uniref:DNA base hypermodification protein n=1 Tax=Amycolatopsis carbonis TaxID=715471 RepID=A0A9Y2IB67_9PSEU|nr:nucleotide kinase domain-containing protein [Amycolatopsis sp. 2-15]WIX77195.1 putative DNA base hypermodification protein [Amycolatopsis sp. 2-15]